MEDLNKFSEVLFDRKKRKTLRELLEAGPVFAPTVWDCFSAQVVRRLGFQAMCLSGAEVAASIAGLPDLGLVTFDELVGVVNHITDVNPLPMIVDIDTGFGNELNVMRTCERIAKAGAMAVHLEDQTFPKRCGHIAGKEVIPRKDYISKIKAAAHAFKGTDCLLIARTDSYNILGKEEAIARNLESLEAGADIAFTEGIDSREAIQEIGERVPGWKMFGMSSKGASPKVSCKELNEWGYNLVTCHFAFAGAYRGMWEFGQKTLQDKSDVYAYDNDLLNGPMGAFELFNIHEWLGLAQEFNPDIKTASRFTSKD